MGIDKAARKAMEERHAQAIESVLCTLSKAVLRRDPRDLLPDQCAILGWSFVVLELDDEVFLGHLLEVPVCVPVPVSESVSLSLSLSVSFLCVVCMCL
jgi:hypothetical protein